APLTAISAGFMHIDLGHLAVNMFLLLLVGREIVLLRLFAGL
ncbi:rhomboid family intramembrane serine protease, partial [Bacteroides fragilis]|nr:rhomboid family intramembrane serine protease [Bacteroides fragilis]